MNGMTTRLAALAIFVATASVGVSAVRAHTISDFDLSDGDTLVFLGDSNTAGGAFAKVVENYALLRYPLRNIHFHNSGSGGDTAPGGLARFQEAVIDKGATDVLVMYGINDICWGFCASPEDMQTFFGAIIDIFSAADAAGINVYFASYPVTGGDPYVDGPLQEMSDTLAIIAAYLHALGGNAHFIDVHGDTRGIYQTIWTHNQGLAEGSNPVKLHSDGVHLTQLGHEAVAYSIIKGLGGPAEVSSVTVSASGPSLIDASGTTVTNLQGDANLLSFDRSDEGLPITFGLFAGLSTLRWIPYTNGLNGYTLTVQDLPAGNYKLEVDGRGVGTFSNTVLQNGVNISARTANAWQPGGPWDAQSTTLFQLTTARRNIEVGVGLAVAYVPGNPNLSSMQGQRAAINADLEALQRTVVAPTTYTFVLEKE